MAPKKHNPSAESMLTVTGQITGWDVDIDFNTISFTKGTEVGFRTCDLIFSIALSVPIEQQRTATIILFSRPPNWVKVAQPKPNIGVADITVSLVAGVTVRKLVEDDEWANLLALAISGRLESVTLSFDALTGGEAIARVLRFSTKRLRSPGQPPTDGRSIR